MYCISVAVKAGIYHYILLSFKYQIVISGLRTKTSGWVYLSQTLLPNSVHGRARGCWIFATDKKQILMVCQYISTYIKSMHSDA